jgi:hypothetical protein
MAKIYGYIQNKESGAILWHGSMTQEHAEHFLTSRGLSVSDHTIVLDATGVDVQSMIDAYDNSIKTYSQKRKPEYPPMIDYLDGIVKGDQAQVDKYIADCLAVKEKYPKGDN